MLDNEFYTKLKQISQELGMSPQDLLIVMFSEGGADPKARSPFGDVGLVQFSPGTLSNMGLSKNEIANFTDKSAVEQLDYVKKYVVGLQNDFNHGRPFNSATKYYHANAYPATLYRWRGDDPSANKDVIVVSRNASSKQERNTYEKYKNWLDRDKDGKVTVEDLMSLLNKLAQNSKFQTMYAQLKDVMGSSISERRKSVIEEPAIPSGGYTPPLHSSWASSGGFTYQPSDTHPKGHMGVDMRAPAGTSVYPLTSGVVTNVGTDPMGGNIVNVQHSGGIRTYYAHLSTVSVQKGDRVTVNSVLGTVGNTGNASHTFPHCHFQVWKDGQIQDPAKYFSIPQYTNVTAEEQRKGPWLSEQAKQEAQAFNMQDHLSGHSNVSSKQDTMTNDMAQPHRTTPQSVPAFLSKIEKLLDSLASMETHTNKYGSKFPSHRFLITIEANDFPSKLEFANILCSAMKEGLDADSNICTDNENVEIECILAANKTQGMLVLQEFCTTMSDTFQYATRKIGGIKIIANIMTNVHSYYNPLDIDIADINSRKFKMKFLTRKT